MHILYGATAISLQVPPFLQLKFMHLLEACVVRGVTHEGCTGGWVTGAWVCVG